MEVAGRRRVKKRSDWTCVERVGGVPGDPHPVVIAYFATHGIMTMVGESTGPDSLGTAAAHGRRLYATAYWDRLAALRRAVTEALGRTLAV